MTEPVRTDMYCHECTRNFVTRLDLRLDGNHVIHCPHCSPRQPRRHHGRAGGQQQAQGGHERPHGMTLDAGLPARRQFHGMAQRPAQTPTLCRRASASTAR